MIYGWDISTSIVGLCAFHDNGKFDGQWHLDLRDDEGLLAKADHFKLWVEKLQMNSQETNTHFIEERLGGFSGGRTSAQVLMKLAQFNALCSYIIWNHHDKPGFAKHRNIRYLHPSTWKALMKNEGLLIPKGSKEKKAITLEFVRRKVPAFKVELNRNDKPQPWSYDEADAFCIGRSGYLKICTESGNYKPLGEL